ncbi:Kelch repeat-containing protein [Robertkochia sediminum]|uniref:Kelch repeat-containing protein n=1 Tax=Robertkochia sediminum TaxID=2785326 RepID=UPI0019315A91|nr:kelch repeat-containing protein [Robertkochia sediminum]MBL7472115.1 hypothetical protein [Robertkochia sediminum]
MDRQAFTLRTCFYLLLFIFYACSSTDDADLTTPNPAEASEQNVGDDNPSEEGDPNDTSGGEDESNDGASDDEATAGNSVSVTSDCFWAEKTASAIERLESQTALIGGRLYTFAGFTHSLEISAQTEILDLETGTWTYGAPMPVAVTHMGAAVVDGKVWIVGGFEGDHPGVAIDAVQIYDPQTDTWSAGPALPSPRASGAVVYLDGALYYFGGLEADRQTDVAELLVLDVDQQSQGWQQMADMPVARNHLGGVVYGGRIYAVGGQTGHDGARDDLAVVHAYDPGTDRWEQLADLPEDRSHFEPGIFTLGDKILVAGGRSDAEYADDVLIYNLQNDTWEVLCELPAPLLAPVSRVYKEQLYVVNGGDEGVCCPLSNVWVADLIVD